MPRRSEPSVTHAQRRLAQAQEADAAAITARGVSATLRLGSAARRAAIRAYRSGHDPAAAALAEWQRLRPSIISAMLLARLKAIRRSRIEIPLTVRLAVSDVFTGSVSLQRRLLDISAADLERLAATLEAPALRIMAKSSALIERRLRQVVADAIESGAHVKEGTRLIANEFSNLGIVPENSFTIETIFRTQTMLAYGAGKADVEKSADVQEILWGYKYVTVGDDRVRPSHAVLDGVTLPKDDEFWTRFYPPNGWNCRCQAIALFSPEETIRPPDTYKTESGQSLKVAPDAGWSFNPGDVLGALTSIGIPAGSIAPA